jgi:hypothetical protein
VSKFLCIATVTDYSLKGVITKPDILTAGSTLTRNLWLEVIEGKRHPLKHGYYCTRQPDDDERAKNITPSDARKSEAMFFVQNEPWKGSEYRSRFGAVNLVNMLSTLLVQIINESFVGLLRFFLKISYNSHDP